LPGDPFWVLSTDYSSFYLVYSCTDYFGKAGTSLPICNGLNPLILNKVLVIIIIWSVPSTWIVARTRSLPSDVISHLHGDLEAIGVDLRRLTLSDQMGCDTVA
ncbi:unnamed protein product, partial [Coregonus sp. 'balchen']